MNKHFPKKYFFSLVTSRTYSIRLTTNLRAHIDSGDPGLSFGYLTILLASIVIEIIAIFCKNSPILRKSDFFYPMRPQIWPDQKMIEIFMYNLPRPIQRRLPLVAIFLSFPVLWGGGGHPPPPPAVRRWLRPPTVRGLIKCHGNGAIFLRNLPNTLLVKKYVTAMLIGSVPAIVI